MSAPVCPDGDLPRCLWCDRREANGCAPRICFHLPGDPVDRPEWFERKARATDKEDIDDEQQARADRIEAAQ